jgi:hypothetical protein
MHGGWHAEMKKMEIFFSEDAFRHASYHSCSLKYIIQSSIVCQRNQNMKLIEMGKTVKNKINIKRQIGHVYIKGITKIRMNFQQKKVGKKLRKNLNA